jgi:hypothetical protein
MGSVFLALLIVAVVLIAIILILVAVILSNQTQGSTTLGILPLNGQKMYARYTQFTPPPVDNLSGPVAQHPLGTSSGSKMPPATPAQEIKRRIRNWIQ